MNKNSSKKRDFPLPRRKESEPGGTGPDGPRRGGGAAIQPFQSDQVDDQARARTLPPALERGGLSPAPTTSRAKMHGIDSLVGITLKQCPAITIRRRKKKRPLCDGNAKRMAMDGTKRRRRRAAVQYLDGGERRLVEPLEVAAHLPLPQQLPAPLPERQLRAASGIPRRRCRRSGHEERRHQRQRDEARPRRCHGLAGTPPVPPSRATETAARGTAGKLKKRRARARGRQRTEETGEGGLKNPPVGVSFLLCFGWRAARSRPGLRSVASRHHSRGLGWGEVVRRDPATASQRCEFATHSDSDPHRWVGLS